MARLLCECRDYRSTVPLMKAWMAPSALGVPTPFVLLAMMLYEILAVVTLAWVTPLLMSRMALQ